MNQISLVTALLAVSFVFSTSTPALAKIRSQQGLQRLQAADEIVPDSDTASVVAEVRNSEKKRLAQQQTRDQTPVTFNAASSSVNTGGIIREKAVKTNMLDDSAVTTPKIADSAVTSPKIAVDSVGWQQLKPETIRAGNIKPQSITGYRIQDGTISANNLSPFVQSLLADVLDATDTATPNSLAKRDEDGSCSFNDLVLEGSLNFVNDNNNIYINAEPECGDQDTIRIGTPGVHTEVHLPGVVHIDTIDVDHGFNLIDTIIHGDLTVTDSTTLHGDVRLGWNSSSQIDSRGHFHAHNGAIVSGDLTVTDSVTVRGNQIIDGRLIVGGDSSYDEADYLPGYGSEANLFVDGDAYFDENVEIENDLHVGDDLNVYEDARIHQNFYVTGNTDMTGSLTVDGNVTLNDSSADRTTVNGLLVANASAIIQDDLTVTDSLSVRGNQHIAGILTIGNTSSAYDADYLDGYGEDARLFVDGDAYFDDDVEIENDLYVGDSLFVHDSATIEDNLTVNRNVTLNDASTEQTTVNGLFHARANAIIQNDLTVTNSSTIQGNQFIGGRLTIGDNVLNEAEYIDYEEDYVALVADGDAFFYYDVEVDDNLYVGDDLSVFGDTTLSGTLAVVGNVGLNTLSTDQTTVNGLLHARANALITGDLTVSNSVMVHGNQFVDGRLTVGGNILDDAEYIDYAEATLIVDGEAYFDDNVEIEDNLHVGEDLYVYGDAHISEDLTVEEDLNVDGTLDVDGAVTFDDTLYVAGATTLNSTAAVNGQLTANSLVVTNNSTLNGNLSVAGTTNLTSLNAAGSAITGLTTVNSGTYYVLLVDGSGNIYRSQDVYDGFMIP